MQGCENQYVLRFSEIPNLSQCKTVSNTYLSLGGNTSREAMRYIWKVSRSDQVTGVGEVRVNAKKSTLNSQFGGELNCEDNKSRYGILR